MSLQAIRSWKKLSYSLKYIYCHGCYLAYPGLSILTNDTRTCRQFSRTTLNDKNSKDDNANLLKELNKIKSDEKKTEDESISSTYKKAVELKAGTDAAGNVAASTDTDSSSSDDDSSSSSSDDEAPVHERLVAAAEQVAEVLPGNKTKTKSDLLDKLQQHVGAQGPPKQAAAADLRSVLGQMNVTQRQRKHDPRGQQLRGRYDNQSRQDGDRYDNQARRDKRGVGFRDEDPEDREQGMRRSGMTRQAMVQMDDTSKDRRAYGKSRNFIGSRKPRTKLETRPMGENPLDKLGLFGAQPLGIFTVRATDDTPDTATVSLYERIMTEQRSDSMTYPATNAFQEMSRWTKEGKMWHYPVNNEQDMLEEAEVGFHEHVFLDTHLDGIPKKGPVRNFMELVINGLSKNPYITAAKKREHIEWYKDYFKDKYAIIDEMTVTAKAEETKS